MIQTKKIRIYPTTHQAKLMNNWIGTTRFLYNDILNRIKKDKEKINFFGLRNKFVTYDSASEYYDEWMFNTPKEVRAGAVRDLVTAYKTNLQKGSKFDMHFKSKKYLLRQNIVIPKLSIKLLGKCRIQFYDRKFNFGSLKCKEKIKTIESDIRIERINPNIWYIILPYTKEIKECKKKKICGNDLGMRKFLTGVGTDGLSYKIGENFYDDIKKINRKIDDLESRYKKTLNDKEEKVALKTKKRLDFLLFKRRNMVDNLHYQTINFLTKRYDIIVIGKFTGRSVKSKSRWYNRMAYSFGYGKFIERLGNKCRLLGKRMMMVDEHWTSKSCSLCSKIDHNLGSSKVYDCKSCGLNVDRDINGSINILMKGLSEVKNLK